MLLLIDNYDSFSYNLYQMLGELTSAIKVIRNDAMTVEDVKGLSLEGIVLSPGPGRPSEAGICEDIVKQLGGLLPILGVCLGHQGICESLGGKIVHAGRLMHGKESCIRIEAESDLFRELEERLVVGRYHSLAVEEKSLPACLRITARAEDGEIMAVEDREKRLYGLQFHPESVLTPCGRQILKNFIGICGA